MIKRLFNTTVNRIAWRVTELSTQDDINLFFKRNRAVQALPYHKQLYGACRNAEVEFLYANELKRDFHFRTREGIHAVIDEYFWIFMEILCDRRYAFYQEWITGPYVMIDMGANRGYAAMFFASDERCHHVYSFEPCRRPFGFIQKHLALNQALARKITAFNFGLSDRAESPSFAIHPHADGFSGNRIFVDAHLDAKRKSELVNEQVELKQASTVVRPLLSPANAAAPGKNVLKIDIEGAEYKVLGELKAAGVLEAFSIIFGECHAGMEGIETLLGDAFSLEYCAKEPVEGQSSFLWVRKASR